MYKPTTIQDVIDKLNEIKEKEGNLEVYVFDNLFSDIPLCIEECEVTTLEENKKVVCL